MLQAAFEDNPTFLNANDQDDGASGVAVTVGEIVVGRDGQTVAGQTVAGLITPKQVSKAAGELIDCTMPERLVVDA